MAYRLRLSALVCLLLVGGTIFSLPKSVSSQQAASVGVGDTVLDLSGKTSPGAFVNVYRDSNLIGSLTADNDGNFSQSFPAQPGGITRLGVSARDSQNRFTDTALQEVNLQQHFHTSVYFFLPTTLELRSAIISGNEPLRLSGQTIPDATISLFIDGQYHSAVGTDTDGIWAATVGTSQLSTGLHGIYALTSDPLGSQSFSTRIQSFSIFRPQPTPPVQPAVPRSSTPQAPAIPQILSPANGSVSKTGRVVVAGSATPNIQIEIWDSTRVIGGIWSGPDGRWELPLGFRDGSHSIRARSCMQNRCSSYSAAVTFRVETSVQDRNNLQATLDKHTLNSIIPDRNGEVILRLKIDNSDPPYQLFIDWGDDTTERLSKQSKDILLKHSYTKPGTYTGRILLTNAEGSRELFFTANVKQSGSNRQLAPAQAIILLILLSGVAVGLWHISSQRTVAKSKKKQG